jgi:hypothetical protein
MASQTANEADSATRAGVQGRDVFEPSSIITVTDHGIGDMDFPWQARNGP